MASLPTPELLETHSSSQAVSERPPRPAAPTSSEPPPPLPRLPPWRRNGHRPGAPPVLPRRSSGAPPAGEGGGHVAPGSITSPSSRGRFSRPAGVAAGRPAHGWPRASCHAAALVRTGAALAVVGCVVIAVLGGGRRLAEGADPLAALRAPVRSERWGLAYWTAQHTGGTALWRSAVAECARRADAAAPNCVTVRLASWCGAALVPAAAAVELGGDDAAGGQRDNGTAGRETGTAGRETALPLLSAPAVVTPASSGLREVRP
jgi:hypothetical protein